MWLKRLSKQPDSTTELSHKKNLKAAELKDFMADEGNNFKLMWVPAHTGIKGNEEADEAARESLKQEV
jgi:ribonuclease HI